MTAYVPVTPTKHDAGCRRGIDTASGYYGLDRERCERCCALWNAIKREDTRPSVTAATDRLAHDLDKIYTVLP